MSKKESFFERFKSPRGLKILAIHASLLILVHWAFHPRIEESTKFENGIVEEFKSCGGSKSACSYGLKLNEKYYTCSAGALGRKFSCANKGITGKSMKIQYLEMPTIASVIGITDKTNVILNAQTEDGDVIYAHSIEHVNHTYLTNNLLLYAIFFMSFFSFIKIQSTQKS